VLVLLRFLGWLFRRPVGGLGRRGLLPGEGGREGGRVRPRGILVLLRMGRNEIEGRCGWVSAQTCFTNAWYDGCAAEAREVWGK